MTLNTSFKYLYLGIIISTLTACDGEPITVDVSALTDNVTANADDTITIEVSDDISATTDEIFTIDVSDDNNVKTDDTAADTVEVEDIPVIAIPGIFIQSVYDTTLCLNANQLDEESVEIAITLQDCTQSDEQRWNIEDSGKIINVLYQNYCLGFEEVTSFSSLTLQTCSDNSNWTIDDGVISTQDLALDVDMSDNSVIAYAIHGNENQQWLINEDFIIGDATEVDDSIDDATEVDDSIDDATEVDDSIGDATEVDDSIDDATEVDDSIDDATEVDDSTGDVTEDDDSIDDVTEVDDLIDDYTNLDRDESWTYLAMSPIGEYGQQTINLPAAQNWVNTGVYLTAGESVNITATGEWQVAQNTSFHGPEGSGTETERGCVYGSLVARIGLFYKDENLGCIGSEGVFTASTDGIVFIGGIVSTDLGESYETRSGANGSLTVTIDSSGKRVPVY